ncbi:hypothetical protein [Scytonema sp. NUACC21]
MNLVISLVGCLDSVLLLDAGLYKRRVLRLDSCLLKLPDFGGSGASEHLKGKLIHIVSKHSPE